GGGIVDHAELEPDALDAGARDRLVDVRARLVGAAEDVYHVDVHVVRDVGDARVAALAEDLRLARVDRDDREALALEQRGDPVRVARRVRRAADDCPGPGGREHGADVVVHGAQACSVSHAATRGGGEPLYSASTASSIRRSGSSSAWLVRNR